MSNTLLSKKDGRARILVLTSLLVVAAILLIGGISSPPTLQAMQMTEIPPENKPDDWIATDEWAVRLAPGTSPDGVAQQLGVKNLGQIGTGVPPKSCTT